MISTSLRALGGFKASGNRFCVSRRAGASPFALMLMVGPHFSPRADKLRLTHRSPPSKAAHKVLTTRLRSICLTSSFVVPMALPSWFVRTAILLPCHVDLARNIQSRYCYTSLVRVCATSAFSAKAGARDEASVGRWGTHFQASLVPSLPPEDLIKHITSQMARRPPRKAQIGYIGQNR